MITHLLYCHSDDLRGADDGEERLNSISEAVDTRRHADASGDTNQLVFPSKWTFHWARREITLTPHYVTSHA